MLTISNEFEFSKIYIGNREIGETCMVQIEAAGSA